MQAISDYLKDHRPQYRQPTVRRLYERIRASKDAPYMGKPGTIEGTRELLFTPLPYIVVYRVSGQDIEIWRIYHTSQDRP